jgi:hypothetical protein
MKYGRILLSKMPDDTTQLLIDICSGVGDLNSADLRSAGATEMAEATNGSTAHAECHIRIRHTLPIASEL